MKKLLSICCIAVLMSCGSDDSENTLSCLEATQNTLTAQTNYLDAESADLEILCNSYRLTLQQQKDACGDPNGAIQTILDSLGDCDNPEVVED